MVLQDIAVHASANSEAISARDLTNTHIQYEISLFDASMKAYRIYYSCFPIIYVFGVTPMYMEIDSLPCKACLGIY